MDKSNCVWPAVKDIVKLLLPISFFLSLLLVVLPSYPATHRNENPGGNHALPASHPATVLFIDEGMQDTHELLSGVRADVKVVTLRGNSDGVRQITAALKVYRNLDSIQIISHGAPGELALGSTSLNDASIDRHRAALLAWGGALKADGGILLYGCNVAQGETGNRFVEHLAQVTGTPIAASTDATGSPMLGGNWSLEKRTAPMSVTSALSSRAMSEYAHILANGTLTFTSDHGWSDGRAYSGSGGAASLPGITIDILNISTASGTNIGAISWKDNSFLSSGNSAYSALTYDVAMSDGSKGMAIKSRDGSGFKLTQFTYYNWGETASFTNTVVGYRDGVQVASMNFEGWDSGYLPQTVSLNSSFNNVDDVRLYISAGGYKGDQSATNHSINNIVIADAVSYAVTYNGNGNTGGSVPTDGTAYSSGSTATVLGNTGSLTRTGYTFNGWNTAANGSGTSYVAGNTFSISSNTTLYAKWTANPASATTGSATSVTATGATLGGTVNDNGFATTVTFDYGLTTGYGTNVAATTGGTIGAGTGSTPVGLSLSSLSCNTLYHFRVKAVNTGGTTYGSDGSFTTTACVPDAPAIGAATAGSGQASVAFFAPGSDGGAAISGYTVTSNPGGFTGTGTTSPITVTGLTNGIAYTFTVTATNSVGTGSASTASNSVTPKANQTITFANPGTQNFGTTPTLAATSDSSLTVSFASGTTSVCTITSGGTLTFLMTGMCTINADQTGNGTYLAATTVAQSFTVAAIAPGAPSIGTATAGVGQATVTFSAPVSDGGASITGYTVSSNPSGGTDSNAGTTGLSHVITGLTAGTAYNFIVTATNSAGSSVASGPSNSVTPKLAQTITFNNPGTQAFGTTPTLIASAPGSAVTFASTTTGVCTITSGGALTFVTSGSCTINADAAGNGTYFAATTVSQTFAVGSVSPGAPTIGTATAGDAQASVTFTAPGFTGGSSITSYTVTSSGGQTASGPVGPITLTGLTNGTAYTFTVTATNATGTGSASAASNSVTPRAAQSITFANPGAQNFGTTPTLSATASSTLSVAFSSSTTGVCTITSGGTLSFVSAGTCTINADQAGNGTYLSATTVSQSFTVNAVAPGAPTIGTASSGAAQATVAFTAPTFTGGATITGYSVTANPGGATGTGASSPITVAGLTNGATYTFTVTATNSAGASVASAASNAVTPKAAQTIIFANPGAQNFGTTPTLTATALGGAVTFSSSTTGVCSISSGGLLAFLATGNCTIHADQSGSTSYTAAPTVSQTFAVSAVAPDAPSIGTATVGNAQATVSFTAPTNVGGGTITGYTVTSSPGGFTGTGATSPITVTGLSNGTAYTFTVTATNSAGTGVASAASNSVTPVLAAPVANALTATVAYGSSANVITPTLGGGTASSLAVSTSPVHGAASVSGLTLIYTPAATYFGTDTFTYTGTNAGGTSAPATVTVTVNPQVPVAGAVSMTVEVSSSNNVVPLVLTGGAVASVAVATAPGHGSAAVNGTTITYTPTAGYMGTDSFTYTATNAGGTSAPGTVTILVNSRPDPSKDAEVIALLNAQVQTAKRFGQTQIGNFQSHLEGLHARSRALSQDGQRFSSRGRAPAPAESTATSLTEFSSGTNTGLAGNSPSALFSPRSSKLGTDARCQAGNMQNCMASGGMRPAGDGMDSLVLGALASAGTRSDWWPWPTLSVNGSSKDLLGSGMNVWSAGTINVGKQSENDSRFTTSGISVGGDNHVTDTLILGVGAGFGHERQKIGSNDTKNRGDSYSIVAYGSYQPEDGFFVDGLIGYGHLAFDAERYVTASGDFAQSERKGSQWFSSLSGGYEYVDGKFLFSPYGRIDLIHTRLDETAESGAGTSNLTYRAQTSRSTKLSLGMRSETTFEVDKGTIKPSLRVEYQHDFAEPGVANMVYSDDLNGTVYQLDMENTDRNTMVLGLGLDFALRKSWQTGLSYKFSHSSSSSSQTQSFGVYLRRAF